jgi:hypothetical protein
MSGFADLPGPRVVRGKTLWVRLASCAIARNPIDTGKPLRKTLTLTLTLRVTREERSMLPSHREQTAGNEYRAMTTFHVVPMLAQCRKRNRLDGKLQSGRYGRVEDLFHRIE